MIKAGKIAELKKLATGVANSRTWELTKIVFEDGFECTTFKNIYSVGQQVNLAVQETSRVDKNGVERKGWEVVPMKPKRESVVAQDSKFDRIMEVLSGLEAGLKRIEDEVASLDVPRSK